MAGNETAGFLYHMESKVNRSESGEFIRGVREAVHQAYMNSLLAASWQREVDSLDDFCCRKMAWLDAERYLASHSRGGE